MKTRPKQPVSCQRFLTCFEASPAVTVEESEEEEEAEEDQEGKKSEKKDDEEDADDEKEDSEFEADDHRVLLPYIPTNAMFIYRAYIDKYE